MRQPKAGQPVALPHPVRHLVYVTYVPDLDAYLVRIGYRGSRAATVDTLHAICAAHVRSIPFENLDVLLGTGVDLDPVAVEQKLIHRGRGGYCFEQNSLLLHMLAALGFQVSPLSGRVRWQRARDYTPARTHVFVRAEIEGESWLADVGVGALSLTSALRLQLDIEQPTSHEPRRLVAQGSWDGLLRRGPESVLFHQVQLAAQWWDVCEFTLEEMPPIDREVGNWYTSCHPGSHFRNRLIAARATSDGRVTLVNREFTRRGRDGVGHSKLLTSPVELLAVLAEEFALHFPADTRVSCPGLDWPDR